jgi:hypothetical protein
MRSGQVLAHRSSSVQPAAVFAITFCASTPSSLNATA